MNPRNRPLSERSTVGPASGRIFHPWFSRSTWLPSWNTGGDGSSRTCLQRPVEGGQGVVVLPIGGLPFAVEPLEKILYRAFAIH